MPGASGEGGKWFKVSPLIFFSFLVKHHFVLLTKYSVGGKIKAFHTRRYTLYLSSVVTLNQYVWVSFNIKMEEHWMLPCQAENETSSYTLTVIPVVWLCSAVTRRQAALAPASHAYCFVTVTVAASFLSSEILVQGPGGVIASAGPFVHICHCQDLSCLLRLQGPCGLKSLDIMILWRKSLRDQHK